MQSHVCAIMVTYNRLQVLQRSLQHVLRQTVQPSLIVIIDNNSDDGTGDYLASLSDKKNIHSIRLEDNAGPAGGIAVGMAYGLAGKSFDYFWVLDDDTFYAPQALEELLHYIQSNHFDMLGLKGANIRFGKKVPLPGMAVVEPAAYAMIDGAIIKTSVVEKVGIVDERFFMMCEDHEYSIRLHFHGYRVGVLHNGTDERLLLGGQAGFTRSSLWRGYYSARNHLLIIRQYFSIMNLLGYFYLQIKLLAAAAIYAPDRMKRTRLRLTGIWHGLMGKTGKTLDPQTLRFESKQRSSIN
ncbi:glycosyltransferase [Pseudoflavitalea rhizosphaerae]|uniref:glycosyltransferase n=1 Tax=Pseudoflavitalea rhizosphaerae TaxID=1884793 RepID=UPI000F8C5E15|nr:glycosyltransferase [Pseudoflavitalea rhizosphaerae]